MTELGKYFERDALGGRQFRHTQYLKPVAYLNNGTYARIVNDFINGDVNFPHVVTDAPMLFYTASDGLRRFCPTRDPNVYVEIGAPYIKPVATWVKVVLNAFTRTANRLLSVNTNVDVSIWMGGHFAKLEFELKGGYVPPNSQFAFPVGLNGLTRTGDTLYASGVPVMILNKPVVYDAANRLDIRQITYVYTVVSGQAYILFTLPSLAGMTRPVVDPTLTLQPDATAGVDTMIIMDGATFNYGTDPNIAAGDNSLDGTKVFRSLIKFDISSIPANSTVTSATLTLYKNYEADTNDKLVGAFRALTQWWEGAKDGVAPAAGEDGSTWNLRNANGSLAWGAAGGLSGTDFAATSTGNFLVTSATTTFDIIITADVQAWVNGSTNYGNWVKIDGTETAQLYKAISASDNATASQRPQLVVIYTSAQAHNPIPIMRV